MSFRKLLHRSGSLFFLLLALTSAAVAQPIGTLGVQYQFPSNGATAISRQTNIIIRPGDILNAATVNSSEISVTGSFSGKHGGTFKLSDDKKTLVFTSFLAFTYTERVTVKLNAGIMTAAGKPVASYSFYFTIQSQPR